MFPQKVSNNKLSNKESKSFKLWLSLQKYTSYLCEIQRPNKLHVQIKGLI